MADDDGEDLVPRSHIRQLEEKAAKAAELETRLAQMERETAFARALGGTDHPMRAYFEKGYEGELDVDAIRSAAKDAGLFPGAPAASGGGQSAPTGPAPEEMAAHARMQAASEGAQGTKPIDLLEAMGPRGSKRPDEILAMLRACGPEAPFRLAEDMQ